MAVKARLSWLAARLFSFLSGGKVVRFVGVEREGGYVFVYSPDVAGFSYLLEPGEAADPKSFMDALYPAIQAHMEAEAAADHAARRRVTDIKSTTSPTPFAQVCYA